ncbi:MAG: hypothetical protein CVV27_16340 [Candidatus Melainabacteria bacterium HGW-Melainabacteria-1]|nr:MAG: hypothetical protein CVV27_16340 [Candidatus Melainabacteria bacterium HGW-Melainabacteria-1]
MRFKFLLEPLMLPILFPFGATADSCFAELSEAGLQVKMGKLFDEVLDLKTVESVEAGKWPLLSGLGHRIGFNHEMGVLASTRNVVKLHFKEPQFIKALWAFHFKTHDFFLALEEPERFIQEVKKRI